MLVKVSDNFCLVWVFTIESASEIASAGMVFTVFAIFTFHHRKSLRFLLGTFPGIEPGNYPNSEFYKSKPGAKPDKAYAT